MVASWFGIARSGALLAIVFSVAGSADARGFGGGGFRGGGSMSMSRGGGFGHGSFGSGGYGRGSFDRGSSHNSGGTFTRSGNYNRSSSSLEGGGSGRHVDGGGSRATDFGVRSPSTRPGAGGSGTQIGGGDLKPAQLPSGGSGASGTRPGGGGSGTQLPANRPGGGGSGVEWRPIDNRPGGGGSGTQWRPDCPKCSDGNDGWFDHPVAAGVVIGAVATAAAIGSTWHALPPDCPPYYWSDTLYYTCDGAYYLPQYEGDTIVYVTVPDPKEGEQPATKQ